MTDARTELADFIAALVDPYATAETYAIGATTRVHRVRHDPLVDQLAAAAEPSGSGYDGHSVPSSRPSARLDAIDRLLAIEAGAAALLWRARQPLSDDVKTNLRRLVGVPWSDTELAEVLKTARRWLAWARTVTGWDAPPFRPHVRCPACDWRDSLRIRLAEQSACCVECGAAWDSATVGVLAEYIRTASERVVA